MDVCDPSDFLSRVQEILEGRRGPTQRHKAPASVAEQLEESIKQLIFDNELPPGKRLLETDLAARFGVSRAPVRDALRMLDKQGLVELVPRRGAVVYEPTASDISNLYEVRAELFALAARKAAAAMDGQMLAVGLIGVELILELSAGADTSPVEFLKVRSGLGSLIYFAANNPRLTAIVNTMGMQATSHVQVFESAAHRVRNAEAWRGTYDAISAHDGDTAAGFARQLVLDSRDELLRRLRESAGK